MALREHPLRGVLVYCGECGERWAIAEVSSKEGSFEQMSQLGRQGKGKSLLNRSMALNLYLRLASVAYSDSVVL